MVAEFCGESYQCKWGPIELLFYMFYIFVSPLKLFWGLLYIAFIFSFLMTNDDNIKLSITIYAIISDTTTPQPLVKSSQCSQNITRQGYIDVATFFVYHFLFIRFRIVIIIIKTGPICKHLRERPQTRETSCILWPATNTRHTIIFNTLLERTIITMNK